MSQALLPALALPMTDGPESQEARSSPEEARILFDLLYNELRALAAARMRTEHADHTLQPTAVVHEAWLRLKDQEDSRWRDRTHFFATAAQVVRRVLIDHARTRGAEKRGGDRRRERMPSTLVGAMADEVDVLELDAALSELGRRSERQMRVIEMRFFGGMSVAETAQALGVSEETVKRDWRLARAWLHRELGRGEGEA